MKLSRRRCRGRSPESLVRTVGCCDRCDKAKSTAQDEVTQATAGNAKETLSGLLEAAHTQWQAESAHWNDEASTSLLVFSSESALRLKRNCQCPKAACHHSGIAGPGGPGDRGHRQLGPFPDAAVRLGARALGTYVPNSSRRRARPS